MRIQIGSGTVQDISFYGFFLGKTPSMLGCDIKESNIIITDFPEISGSTVYIPPTPALKSFDYPITFIYFSDSIDSANQVISDFYNSMLGEVITIYNDFKKVMVKGYAKSYKEGEFYRSEKDIVIFDIVFFIPKPQDCNFDL